MIIRKTCNSLEQGNIVGNDGISLGLKNSSHSDYNLHRYKSKIKLLERKVQNSWQFRAMIMVMTITLRNLSPLYRGMM